MAAEYIEGTLPGMDYFGDTVRRSLMSEAGVHEGGHALLDAVNGTKVGVMKVWIVGNQVVGFTGCERPTVETLPGWLVSCAAGQAAQAIWLEKYRKMSFEQGLADCKVNACGDLEMFAKARAKFGGSHGGSLPTWEQALRQAYAVLTKRWMWVERYASTLVEKGEMKGEVVNADANKALRREGGFYR